MLIQGCKIKWGLWFFLIIAIFLLSVASQFAYGGEERYDYDELGRLVRVIDEQNRVTEYVYDATGNLLQVITNGTLQPPTVAGLIPNIIHQGETKAFQIVGTGFNNIRVGTSSPELSLSDLASSPTEINFSLSASLTAPLGVQQITLANAAGNAIAQLTVTDPLPSVISLPSPFTLLPDNLPQQLIIRLSHADLLANSFTLSIDDPSVATVSPNNATIPAGQLETTVNVTGLKAGQVFLSIASPTLGQSKAAIYVLSKLLGENTSYSAIVGVNREGGGETPTPIMIDPLVSPIVGATVGSYIENMAPQFLTRGTGPVSLIINGAGLEGATSVSFVPADGITLGALSVAPDGRSVTVPVTTVNSAPPTMRQVILSSNDGPYIALTPTADRVKITFPAPEVHSIEPLFATPGSTTPFVIRGVNLQDTSSINFNPAAGIIIGTAPVIKADGTELRTALQIAPNAASGQRIVTVTNPSGTSSGTASVANIFGIVNTIQQNVTPILSPVVEVIREGGSGGSEIPITLGSDVVGVAVGSVVKRITPSAATAGETSQIVIEGNGLQTVSALRFVPDTGITIDNFLPAADGRSITVDISIAADAPRIVRSLEVIAGTDLVTAEPAFASLFRIASGAPRIDSVSPNTIQTGTADIEISVRGANLDNLQQLQFIPADGISILGTPTISSDGTEVILHVAVSANASVGERVVQITTAVGQTSNTPAVSNTINLTTAAVAAISPLLSPIVGVERAGGAGGPVLVDPLLSSIVGVMVEETPPPPATQFIDLVSSEVGVAVGPSARFIEPNAVATGGSGVLTISGFALNDVDTITANPSDGITLGSLQINAQGTTASASYSVAGDAAPTIREIIISSAGNRVEFSDPAGNRLRVVSGVPEIQSISPILGARGASFAMTIRGLNFTGLTSIVAEPATGITFGASPVINSTGTQITVQVSVAANAPLGARVIRIITPAGTTSADASPANTFTVFE